MKVPRIFDTDRNNAIDAIAKESKTDRLVIPRRAAS
jgi:hypothetical protein